MEQVIQYGIITHHIASKTELQKSIMFPSFWKTNSFYCPMEIYTAELSEPLILQLDDFFSNSLNGKQEGRLAPAYFSPHYNHFYQLLRTVKNETTVLNLVFKGF